MLQVFDLNLAAGQEISQAAVGSYIQFLSGSVSSGAVSIGVRLGNSADKLVLGIGQGIKLDPKEAPDTWRIQNLGTQTLTGTIVIGSGEFLNNQVSVGGGVTISGVATVQENQIAVTGTWASTAVQAAGFQQVQIFAAGVNVNGVIVQNWDFMHYPAAYWTLVAKSGAAPANITDGDVLYSGGQFTAATSLRESLKNKTKIAAGKGLYFCVSNGDSAGQPTMRNLAYTVL